jgi:hypothetical protein
MSPCAGDAGWKEARHYNFISLGLPALVPDEEVRRRIDDLTRHVNLVVKDTMKLFDLYVYKYLQALTQGAKLAYGLHTSWAVHVWGGTLRGH